MNTLHMFQEKKNIFTENRINESVALKFYQPVASIDISASVFIVKT